MTHTYEYIRQPQRNQVKPGGILINPEDALPSMRDQIHTDPRVGTYALLKAPHGESHARTRHFEYEFTKPITQKDPIKTGGVLVRPEDARVDMRDSLHVDPRTNSTYALLKPAGSKVAQRRFSYEFLLPGPQKAHIKTGGILINPEDARPDMRHTIHIDPRSKSTYAILKPFSEVHRGQGSSEQTTEGNRLHTLEFFKKPISARRERVKTGGILIKPEDARADMRHSIHIDPRTNSTYAILKPFSEVHRGQGSSEQTTEGNRLHTLEFFKKPISARRERVKTGGILIKPEDARADMRHNVHVDPRTNSTFAILKPFEERRSLQSGIETRSSLNDMTHQVDRILNRSRNILSESYVNSVSSLGYLPEAGLA